MNITLNGRSSRTETSRLLDLVAEVTGRRLLPTGQPADGRRLGVAVAHNSEVVPRAQWAHRSVAEGDAVELVTAVQGG